jgi:transposase-like protein
MNMRFTKSEVARALRMRDEDDATYAEIAYQVGCSASGIRRAMLRTAVKAAAAGVTSQKAEDLGQGFMSGIRRGWRKVSTLGLGKTS